MARRLRVPSGTEGVLVTDVELGSPAQRAGISRGDVILQVNRRPVASPQEAEPRPRPGARAAAPRSC